MNYEQKYKKALSFLKDLKPHMSDYCIEKLEAFFPELKESEDEMIRKEITEYITSYKDCITDKEYNSWIAWLEKQGEQPSWSEEDADMIDNIIRCLKRLGGDIVAPKQPYQEEIDWLKSINPKHWKPSDEQIKSLRIALQTMPYSKDKENVLVILEELNKL